VNWPYVYIRHVVLLDLLLPKPIQVNGEKELPYTSVLLIHPT
jgi:hypothetical protein